MYRHGVVFIVSEFESIKRRLKFVCCNGRFFFVIHKGFGLGGSGQLGNRTAKNSQVPQVVVGPWASPNGVTLLEQQIDEDACPLAVRRIFSGGDQSFASILKHDESAKRFDCRIYEYVFVKTSPRTNYLISFSISGQKLK